MHPRARFSRGKRVGKFSREPFRVALLLEARQFMRRENRERLVSTSWKNL